LLADGFSLPDLSADHVFAERHDGGWQLAVLDLHNGGVGAPGRPTRKLLARVLRRYARSVRGLPLLRRPAIVFATRLLRAAGAPRALRRELVRATPAAGTAFRYEQAGKSNAYAARNPRRAARERALLERIWPGRPGETVLDVPCGTGRLLPFLHERGHGVVLADGAVAMLRQARADHGPERLVQADALALPMGQEHITVCTVGNVPGIEALSRAGMKRLNLSVSLNAARDELRSQLMPVNRRTPLAELQRALAAYRPRANFALGVNYCLMPGINDQREDASDIARF
jgi:hypothetical protein